ncbi:MAG: CoA transferase [Pseudomonadota bacterium]
MLGAAVWRRSELDPTVNQCRNSIALSDRLDLGKPLSSSSSTPTTFDLILTSDRPSDPTGSTPQELAARYCAKVVVSITPFGVFGSNADDPASDLTLLARSGIARQLTGQVNDLSEPPLGAVGEQSAFISAIAALTVSLAHVRGTVASTVQDVSMHDALATLAIQSLAEGSRNQRSWSRQRVGDGNGSTVCILPAKDGHFAVSPREDHQWLSWLNVMGNPAWGDHAQYKKKVNRAENWDEVYGKQSEWSRKQQKEVIALTAQAAHVPSFPLRELSEQLEVDQFRHRNFFREASTGDQLLLLPSTPLVVRHSHLRDSERPGDDGLCPPEGSSPEHAPVGELSAKNPSGIGARASRRVSRSPQDTPGSGSEGRLCPGADGLCPAAAEAGGADGGRASDRAKSGAQDTDARAPGTKDTDPRPDFREDHRPLAGVTIVDFSWVIAGPTTTRYLAALGAEVIKIEAPGRGDPGRQSLLHTVLGQNKYSVTLDLKNPSGQRIARDLIERADVVIENFATGVMNRLGLDYDTVSATNPRLIYVSASGLGREGPEASAVAYGTLLQCYSGFAALNGHPGRPPRVGMAWLDPMCGLMLSAFTSAGLHYRERTGLGLYLDFSMLEAMLWTLTIPLIETQLHGPLEPHGNRHAAYLVHGIFPAAGEDEWIAITARDDDQWQRLCAVIPDVAALRLTRPSERDREAVEHAVTAWTQARSPDIAERTLLDRGIPAGKVRNPLELVSDPHLIKRGFWQQTEDGLLPGLPWRDHRQTTPRRAPRLGEHNELIMKRWLNLNDDAIAALNAEGVFGSNRT